MNLAGWGYVAGGAAKGIEHGVDLVQRAQMLKMTQENYENQNMLGAIMAGSMTGTHDVATTRQLVEALIGRNKGVSALLAKIRGTAASPSAAPDQGYALPATGGTTFGAPPPSAAPDEGSTGLGLDNYGMNVR